MPALRRKITIEEAIQYGRISINTKSQEEYDRILLLLNKTDLESFMIYGFKSDKNFGFGIFPEKTFTDGVRGKSTMVWIDSKLILNPKNN